MLLTTGSTLKGKAGTTSVINYMVFADRKTTTDSYELVGKGQLTTSVADMLTTSPVAASTQLIIPIIELANTSASPVTGVVFYINGSTAADQVNGGFSIPANGTAVYAKGNWQILDSAGSLVTTVSLSLSGDATGTASGGIIPTVLATVNANVGSFGTASSAPTVTVNAKGLVTAAANTPIAVAESQVTGLVSDLAAKALSSRLITTTAPLTGGGDLSADRTLALTTSPVSQVPVGVTRSIGTTAPITGGGDLSADRTLALTTSPTGQVPVGVTRTLTATTPIQVDATTSADLSANRTLSIIPATVALAGSMSALDKQKLDNLWIDVTANPTALVLAANTGAQNITAINAILSAAPNGSTIYFPPGIYLFNAAWTMPNKMFTFCGRGSNRAGSPATAFSELRWNANVGGNLITLPGSGNGWYTQFRDLTFTAITADQAAGAVISANGNVGVNVFNCSFQSAGAYFFDVLSYDGGSGSNSANSTVVENCNIQGFKNNGVRCNASGSSLVIANSVIQGQWGTTTQCAAACVSGGFVGALQINDCDLLGAVNNLLLNPVLANSEVCASVFCTNTYMDNSLGSCVKITGTGATVRARFDTCSFTTAVAGAGSYSAVEVASTFAYAAGGQGLDFVNCNILNTFATTGTTNGFLISGTADFSIGNCRIAGWTNGVQVTPIGTAGRTQPNISNCTIGPAGGYGGNSVGILLNAGSAAYGPIILESNILDGNTSTPLTDNSTSTVPKLIGQNSGLPNGTIAFATFNSTALTTVETVVAGLVLPLPANSVKVGTTFRVTLHYDSAVTTVTTVRFRIGTSASVPATNTSVVAIANATTLAPCFMTGLSSITAVGAAAAQVGNGTITNGAAVAASGAGLGNLTASGSFASTAANFLMVTLTNTSTTTTTVLGGLLEILG